MVERFQIFECAPFICYKYFRKIHSWYDVQLELRWGSGVRHLHLWHKICKEKSG